MPLKLCSEDGSEIPGPWIPEDGFGPKFCLIP